MDLHLMQVLLCHLYHLKNRDNLEAQEHLVNPKDQVNHLYRYTHQLQEYLFFYINIKDF